jgi:NADP-dependent 3-hydroxy acid dehydrogenase YdfG
LVSKRRDEHARKGTKVILTGRNPERLQRAASVFEALSTSAFDATDPASLERFFRDLPATIDHVMVTAGGPHYGLEQARRAFDEHPLLMLQVARNAAHKPRHNYVVKGPVSETRDFHA